jgi:hypothetical protein
LRGGNHGIIPALGGQLDGGGGGGGGGLLEPQGGFGRCGSCLLDLSLVTLPLGGELQVESMLLQQVLGPHLGDLGPHFRD